MIISTDKSADTTEWITLGEASDFAEGTIHGAELPSGLPIAIFNVGGDFYATADRCTHGGASFAEEGEIEGHILECAWHNGTFDVRTGLALTLPCRVALMTFETKVDNNQLLLNPKPVRRKKEDAE
ncbi:MAG: non-heme iron oxygenase ferredoxin subunit [Porticoccaceae bacterium]|nr:non-heme iron oxygenase ferredoxin subunit [Pseudomonadales bacterium]MCP5172407.1 non-heme iron oxygenase ferredoxin subunit [Pseudomonadales bacterium]